MTKIKKLTDKVAGLSRSSLTVFFSEARLDLRDGSEYAHKDRLNCRIFVSFGQVRVNDDEEPIYATINIEPTENLIKDCSGKDNNRNFWIDLKNYDWSKEPETYWGNGAFSDSGQLYLYLYCTYKEFPILQTIISESLKRDGECFIGLDIGHPDYMTEPDFSGDIKSTDEYIEGLINKAVRFYVRGWNIDVGLKQEDDY
jgi:hypothetical protein